VSEQPTEIARLKEGMANGRVVIIVGTGVSVAACGNQDVGVTRWQHGQGYWRTGQTISEPFKPRPINIE
jgi:hypothetical protein